MLLVGDGDFSLAVAMVRLAGGDGSRLVATSYDYAEDVRDKYKQAESNIRALEKAGASVLHGVDGRRLHRKKELRGELFDRIVFFFPHSGQQRVHVNRLLLSEFFSSAARVLAPGGEVHVALKTFAPYIHWNAPGAAAAAGLDLVVQHPLASLQLREHGYIHRTTDPNAVKFRSVDSMLYVFAKSAAAEAAAASSKKRRAATSTSTEIAAILDAAGGTLFPVALSAEARPIKRRKLLP
ncbi:uncharacterized protein AMSG_02596 [Thecamonas trahens ATCC 50062]|uniref:25S rRNA (uridine-N(3))-methyltransferase BMT5-like domain-containing protein n=1 Tax=Thecamonas trahens ATCC 50062 TaxID=461836 RepID=A0A0L0D693_THETB|nr:hypothetical protein AMSG_02596 [Thecamonas trahens ATCC 50062]KNC47571.1 hypothetical protein AMSG_02596 [Thecamonas trahens ATCC 50062]|eukprot:XP_013759503.1 hypothetical protein AMSG_02596 [Thecamonas trahens ATCC 50062]